MRNLTKAAKAAKAAAGRKSDTRGRRRALAWASARTLEPMEGRLMLAGDIVVNTFLDTADPDDGVTSLREAIVAANADPGANTIKFGVGDYDPDLGPATIMLSDALPALEDAATTIDGSTQAGAERVVVDGAYLTIDGLVLQGSGHTIRNVVVSNFGGSGIVLAGEGYHGVFGSYIGTDAIGTTYGSNNADGVLITSSHNTVGGLADGERNVISGNTVGVRVQGTLAGEANVIRGNYLGVDFSGYNPVGNFANAVHVEGVADVDPSDAMPAVLIASNVISGNFGDGIRILGSSGVVVAGNTIGLDAGGQDSGVGNSGGGNGVYVAAGAHHNRIGGTSDGKRNLIAANSGDGVRIDVDAGAGNEVLGNFIGLAEQGTVAAGNGGNGVSAFTPGNIIGAEGAGNVIAANYGNGVTLTSGSVVVHNLIGVAADGTTAAPNAADGVFIGDFDELGNPAPAGGNFVAHNTIAYSGDPISVTNARLNGVTVVAAGATGNSLRANSVFANYRLGIDVGNDGVTADGTPVVTSAVRTGASMDVAVSLTAAPGTYAVDIFASAVADPSGYGEGQFFLGTVSVTVDGSGMGTATLAGASVPATGTLHVTATATDAAGTTSEFGLAVAAEEGQVEAQAPTSTTVTASLPASVYRQEVTFTATVSSDEGVPGGLVEFFVDGVSQGYSTLNAEGKASLVLAFEVVGGHTVVASYLGNDDFAPSAGNATHAVGPDGTSVTLTSSANPAALGQSVTLTATVTAVVGTLDELPDDVVEFILGNASFQAPVIDGVATYVLGAMPAGSYTYEAAYKANVDFYSDAPVVSLTQAVSKGASTTSVTLSAVSVTVGQQVVITATVDDAVSGFDAGGGTMTFDVGGTIYSNVAPNPDGTFSVTHTTLAVGALAVVATWSGDANFEGSAGSASLQVTPVGSSISGHTRKDRTGNGLSADDTALGGITVHLFLDRDGSGTLSSGDGAALLTETSSASGYYSFHSLDAGRYFVQEVVPAGFIRTYPALSSYHAVEVGGGGGGGMAFEDLDFANFKRCNCGESVSGITYTINPGQPGEKTVTNLRGNVDQGDTVKMTFTVAEGQEAVVTLVSYTAPSPTFIADEAHLQEIYDIEGGLFYAGTHSIDVEIPEGYFQVDAVCGEAIDQFGPAGSNVFYTPQGRLLSADNDGVNAPSDHLLVDGSSKLSGYVFHDADNDGVRDAGEAAIANASVHLTGGDGVDVTVRTNSKGRYVFEGLAAGNYTLTEIDPSGYLDGKEKLGTMGGTITGAIGSEAMNLTLGAGQSARYYNFGEVKAAKLSGYVYKDYDNDARRESGEGGIRSVTIRLVGVNDRGETVTRSVATNSSGYYEFSGLRPGEYNLYEVDPAGYGDGKESLGTLGGVKINDGFEDIFVTSGASGTNYNFGERPSC